VVAAYRTVLPRERSTAMVERLEAGEIDCLTFTSSSTVSNFFSLFEQPGVVLPLLKAVCVACIGPITAKTATEHGLKVDVMPSDYTITGLVEAIRSHFENEGG
jgi:uroporphyrinogen III methyltransferase/synthase